MLTLIIPVYNEQEAIEETVHKAHQTLTHIGEDFEILVINDGSTDGTADVLAGLHTSHLTVIDHVRNRGYGSSMKTGIRRAHGDLIAITDADGTYPIGDFPRLLQVMREQNADMVVGARTKKGAHIPLIRRPAKAIVALLANTLTGVKIPDNNSGMRIFTRQLAESFMHIYPSGFSFTLTITLAALTNDYIVSYTPIDYYKRKGQSSLSQGFNGLKNFLNFLALIVRIVMYFRPLKFFAWPSVLLIAAGIITAAYTLWHHANISDAGLLLMLTGLQIGLFGMLAEIVVRYRQPAR